MDQLIIDECTLETELKSYEDQVIHSIGILNPAITICSAH